MNDIIFMNDMIWHEWAELPYEWQNNKWMAWTYMNVWIIQELHDYTWIKWFDLIDRIWNECPRSKAEGTVGAHSCSPQKYGTWL
jgi:hypothetical protein